MNEPTLPTRPQVAHAASLLGRKAALWTLLIGLAASVAAFLLVRHEAQADAAHALRDRTRQITRAFEAKVALPVQALEAVVAFRRASLPERAAFSTFARTLLAKHPSLAALEYARVVPASERAALEARLSAEVGREVRIREPDASGKMVPSPERQRYTVLTLLEPWNEDVVGLDLGFEPERQRALERTAELGARYCSNRIRLVEDPPGVYSVVVYEPDFEQGQVPSDPIERRRAVRGFAIALFRLEPLMQQALNGLDTEGIAIGVLDRDELAAGREDNALLFQTRSPMANGDSGDEREFTFAGRTWVVRTQAVLEPSTSAAWLALALGVGVSVFFAVALGALAEARRYRREVRQIRRLGQYVVLRLVAAGGMGRVYEAQHAMLKRRTALKVVSRDSASEELLKRFEREVRATSLLTHPNTVIVYDYGRSGHGHFYYAMEYIEGPSLDELVRLEGRLPTARVRHLLMQVAGALAEAHGQGFVHRDVKPSNLMATTRGGLHDVVKVLDFGLVRDVHARTSRLTTSGSVSGTPGYVPPEVFADPEAIGPATDVYAVGCVAHMLLTGREVFDSPNAAEVVAAHIGLVPEAPSARYGVDPVFDDLVMRCLDKDPRRRYADCGALLAALEALPCAPWPQAEARASWQRWEAARAARPAESHDADAISHLEVALGEGRIADRRAYMPTQF